MLFSLILLIACVASRADKMEMINSYLDQMTARVGYSVNYALDKAFAETASGSDLEIYALKKDVIAQAQSMFRPLAKNILVDSLQPRLQKRAKMESSRDYTDFADPNEEINHAYYSDRENVKFKRTENEHFISPDGHDTTYQSPLFANTPDKNHDSLVDSPLFRTRTDEWHNLDFSQHGSVLHTSDLNQPGRKKMDFRFHYDPKSYRSAAHLRDEVLYEEISLTGKNARGKSWNIKFAEIVGQIVARCFRALKYVLDKLNLGKFTETLGDRFSTIFHSETAHIGWMALIGIGLGYLVHNLIQKKKVDEHEYFE
jgi:hypothetical protein